jgi:hypothetical protein
MTAKRSATEMRMIALRKAYELQHLLQEVIAYPEYGEGSCPARALESLEAVIASLRPSPAASNDDDPGARMLTVG